MVARLSPPQLVLAAAAALSLSACGSLDTPDVGTGEVVGRLTSVKDAAAAKVYVLGKPELESKVGADGSYRISNVPAGPATKLVFYDGGAVNQGRAEVVTVAVRGATRVAIDKGDEMPLAARVVVLPRAWGGCKSDAAEVTLEGTDQRGRRRDARGKVELFPVPQGEWLVRGALKGFKAKDVAVAVAGGVDAPVEIVLDEQDDSPDAHGCLGATCNEGLTCERDGRCYAYECTDDDECGSGGKCDDHVCVVEGADHRDACEPCTADAQCGVGGACVASGVRGYCATPPSAAPGDQPCGSGYAVAELGGRTV
jgi:hypothetical protein